LRLGRKSSGTEVRQLTSADSSFDQLWLKTRHVYANTNIRSAKAVNWLCFGGADFRKQLFGCFTARHLVGYVIAVSLVRGQLRVLSCVDLWLDPDAPTALADLLTYIESWARAQNFDVLEVPQFAPFLGRQLDSLGLFRLRTTGEQQAYYKTDSSPLDSASSYFVGLQGDRGL
jgi:hypothetical protein